MNESNKYVYGINPVKEYLKIVKKGVLFIRKNNNNTKIAELIEKAKSKNLEITYIDNESFKKFFPDINHQGIALKIEEDYTDAIDENNLIDIIKNDTQNIINILILDGIKDPGNLGAVLRSALLFDASYVILPKDNTCPINEIVNKRSSGAAAFLKIIYVTNLVRIIDKLKEIGFWIYSADMEGTSINKIDFSDKKVIIIGEEEKGIRRLVKENSDFLITIPTNKKIDSLNLSVSAGIILYELYKKSLKE